jgi:arylsulfatase A-like enzyme
MHGSPYTYDTFVPILLAGPGVRPAVSRRAVTPAQLAPTLAALLGLKPPSAADGVDLLPVFAEAASTERQR